MDRLMPGSSAFIPSKPKSGKKRQKVLSEDSDDEGPSKLEKVGKKKKKQAFSQRSYRFYLPGLDLPKDSKAHYPDFNWLDLVAKEEEAKVAATMKRVAAAKKKDSLDPFASDDEEQIKALTRQFEEKYGGASEKIRQKKKTRNKDDYADLGYGYDSDDPFIDNTDVHDEIVPKNLTTAHGGFYVNYGPLEFKARESADEDSDSEPEPVRPVSPPPKVAKKKKKVPKNSQNGQKPPKMPVKVRKEDSDSDIELLVDGKIPAKKPMPLKKVFTKGFPCSYCPKKFTHKNNLRVHMKEKHKEQLLQWYKKNSGSPNPMKMSNDQTPSKANAKVNESAKGIFPCTYCNGKFTQKNDLREHMKQKHKEQLLQWAKSGSPNPKKIPNDQTPSMEIKKVNEISKDSKKVSLIGEKSDVVEYQLPYGWKKVGHRRSDNQTWDFYVYGPNGERFRSNVEIKKYLDMNPEVKCDMDVTNTFRIKNSQNDHSRELLKTN